MIYFLLNTKEKNKEFIQYLIFQNSLFYMYFFIAKITMAKKVLVTLK